ncbi:probable ubiquitin carboxyl-terminal hydrolase MINDY-4 isoform X5 [Mauremys reevesii]|nr:probable ubiquitin carboxyl-terminal hydrolase MINDY-4 isoform X5 [Mauremys reevesii]XP_039379137.1 probable ubiquitin carboxyl-terminal hydrolase MINDY-4 isoform X5 [Mauremys reevesii]XP_039379138.1 probable ubiquitin carboxyl-terminal hydrolase MINDY-4 isoform X5 [Mauremys reevesii]XP_039379139.1 probable ubiquitin carboxyl-terminal hydrolase MINDY-4 isoform X5 [Mauremys reevesii]
MDREFPRTALSINNRNELRNVLHLQSLYKQNKAKENPLKTILEVITNYFLEHFGTTRCIASPAASVLQAKSSQPRCIETSSVNDYLDEDMHGRTTVSDASKTEVYRYDIDVPLYKDRHQHKSEKSKTVVVPNSGSSSEGDKKSKNSRDDLKITETSEEMKTTMREKQRSRSGLIVRGMMAGPTASSQEDSVKRRLLKRSSGINSTMQFKEEDHQKNSSEVLTSDFQEIKGISTESMSYLSSHNVSGLKVDTEFSSKISSNSYTTSVSEKLRHTPKDTADPLAKLLERERTKVEERKSMASFDIDTSEKTLKLSVLHRDSEAGREKRERSPKNNENRLSGRRKTPSSISNKSDQIKDVLELVDFDDEATIGEVSRIPELSTLYTLEIVSKAIDISLAKEIKSLLFGSSLCCFSEEWKIQNFTFNSIPQLKYGIVQKKGGPCGVLAAVQACVLQQLLFGDSHRNSDVRCLQPSDAHRTKCLTVAIADILWRAGGNEKAVVALSSGRQQFTPAGKYKADGIFETLILHSVTKYEDLTIFLQQNIHQFETGPFGCILLTVSVIFTRSIDLVRNDFDVSTNQLIGTHGYCTQELVNLLLTGKAVSNVFNDVIELDSGNGNITVLKGITNRSDIGLLSLFEHYDVCQVGCYLKTPRYPIWVVCSESHFSVLFCLRKDLLGDWKTERRFDLYYYDGLANQEEEIRLTIQFSLTLKIKKMTLFLHLSTVLGQISGLYSSRIQLLSFEVTHSTGTIGMYQIPYAGQHCSLQAKSVLGPLLQRVPASMQMGSN